MAIVIFENYGTVFKNCLDTLYSVFSRKSSSKIISIAVTSLGPASLRYCNGRKTCFFCWMCSFSVLRRMFQRKMGLSARATSRPKQCRYTFPLIDRRRKNTPSFPFLFRRWKPCVPFTPCSAFYRCRNPTSRSPRFPFRLM